MDAQPQSERGQALLISAFALLALVIIVGLLVDLQQVYQAVEVVNHGARNAAVDGVNINAQVSVIGNPPPARVQRVLAIDSDKATSRTRASLAMNLESIRHLIGKGMTPESVAASAEIAVINPRGGQCVNNPYATGDTVCYYDPFVAMRVTVPLKALWGGMEIMYQTVVTGALTDNTLSQAPPTPMPTMTPAPVPTFPLPRP